MYDVWKITIGLIIFIVLFTSPIWLNLFSASSKIKPELVYPKDSKQCIEDKDYMNHYHMDILNEWRDKVVRNNQRYLVKNGIPITYNGERLEMSLSLACMKCHGNKQQFCDQCHNYLGVKPYCWDCHVEPSRSGK